MTEFALQFSPHRLAAIASAQACHRNDAMSRVASVGNPATQVTPLIRYGYSPDGFLVSFSDAQPNGTAFAYDGFDRLSTTTYPDTSTESSTYDVASAERRHWRFCGGRNGGTGLSD